MSKPLICFIGPKPPAFAANDEYESVLAKSWDDVFDKLGDRLPAAFLPWNDTCIEQLQMLPLPTFAKNRCCVAKNAPTLRDFLTKWNMRPVAIYYVCDDVLSFPLRCVMQLSFEEFYDKLDDAKFHLEEPWFFFDSKIQRKKSYDPTFRSFVVNIWPTLSQCRGFVKKFMHYVPQDLTPEHELAMFAMAQGFPANCFWSLSAGELGSFFELPGEVPIQQPESKQLSLNEVLNLVETTEQKITQMAQNIAKQTADIQELTARVDALIRTFLFYKKKLMMFFFRFAATTHVEVKRTSEKTKTSSQHQKKN